MNLRLFILGWRRRSLMILDNAGCPRWLAKLRCPALPAWGLLLNTLTEHGISTEDDIERRVEERRLRDESLDE